MIILLIIIGSKVIYKDDYAVIEGNVILASGEGGTYKDNTFTINYPSGFNANNCVVVALGTTVNYFNENGLHYGFNYGDVSFGNESVALLVGNQPKQVRLLKNNIELEIFNVSGNEQREYYRIVLMKI